MRRLLYLDYFLIFFILFLSNAFIFSQSCSYIVLENQSQIDAFPIKYPHCKNIDGWVDIQEDEKRDIVNLLGLSNIESINGNLIIYSTHLVDLKGLENLKKVGGIVLEQNDLLKNLKGLENLFETTSSYFRMINNPQLTTLSDLKKFNSVAGEVVISGNPKLLNLTGLDNIEEILGDLKIDFNDALNSLDGLNNLETIGGSMYIGYNKHIVDLQALHNLKTVGEYVILTSNTELNFLYGLENLDSINGELWLYNNDKLENFDQLKNLKAINGSLRIWNNEKLNDIAGLANINSNTIHSNYYLFDDIEIFNNPNLSFCSIKPVCDLLSSPQTTFLIENNSNGCNSRSEIENECVVNVSNVFENNWDIYPNPTHGQLSIMLPKNLDSGTMEIYNIDGILIDKVNIENKNRIELKLKLNNGTYLMKLNSSLGELYVKKFVVIK